MTVDHKKKRILTLAALVFLFAVRWMFYRLEIDSQIDAVRYAAESGFFLLLYGLGLFPVPAPVSCLCLVCGSAAFCVWYGVAEQSAGCAYLLPLTWLPVFLFFLLQQTALREKKQKRLGPVLLTLMQIYPLPYGGVVLYSIIKGGGRVRLETVYCLVLCLLVGGLYFLVGRTPVKHQGKTKKQREGVSFASYSSAFFAVAIVIAESGLLFLFSDALTAAHTVPVLWLVDLILLGGQEHAQVNAFVGRGREKLSSFLRGGAEKI